MRFAIAGQSSLPALFLHCTFPPAGASRISLSTSCCLAACQKAPAQLPHRIAIVGGGLAGLSVTYHLLDRLSSLGRDAELCVFDPADVGNGGASGATAGLLHPYSRRLTGKVWMGEPAMREAMSLIDVVEKRTGIKVRRKCGVLRIVGKDEEELQEAAHKLGDEVEWWDAGRIKEVGADGGTGGVFFRRACVVDGPEYLRGLWYVCEDVGRVAWRKERVFEVGRLFEEGFEVAVVTTGAAVKEFGSLTHLPITKCRGQNVHYTAVASAGTTRGPSIPLLAGKYVIPGFNNGSLIAGATFEYSAEAMESPPNVKEADKQLSEPVQKRLLSSLDIDWKPLYAVAGVRALPPRTKEGRIPMAGLVKDPILDRKFWVLTGLGSRGLLYHALMGKNVARAIIDNSLDTIYAEARKYVYVQRNNSVGSS